jgi:hypothetical protein
MDSAHRFIKNDRITYKEEEDGAFLFDPEKGNLKYMNRSAKEIFLILNGQNSVGQVINRLLAQYDDADAHQIKQDVESFLKDLLANRFVSLVGDNNCMQSNG